jgi:hypothetical protein
LVSIVFGKSLKKHDDKAKRIKHERIAPMGGMIGFVREKYYDDPKKVFFDEIVLFCIFNGLFLLDLSQELMKCI